MKISNHGVDERATIDPTSPLSKKVLRVLQHRYLKRLFNWLCITKLDKTLAEDRGYEDFSPSVIS